MNRERHGTGEARLQISGISWSTRKKMLAAGNNLIKKYKPRYNVLLKRRQDLPVHLRTERIFPQVFKNAKIISNGSSYYGPYSHIPSMYAVLDLIKHLYLLRTCNLNLPETYGQGSSMYAWNIT